MTNITVRLPDNILQRMDTNAHRLHMTRSEYIKNAIVELSRNIEDEARRQKLQAASLRVREESMKINAEFSEIEHDPEA